MKSYEYLRARADCLHRSLRNTHANRAQILGSRERLPERKPSLVLLSAPDAASVANQSAGAPQTAIEPQSG